MKFLYDLLYDLLVISLILKLLWDADISSLPRGLIAVGIVGVPFLLGIGGRRGLTAIRIGVGATGLTIFLACLSPQNRTVYFTMLAVSSMVYLWSRLARKALSLIIAAFIVTMVILYLVYVVRVQ